MLQQNPGQFGHFQLSLGDFLEYSGQFFSSKTALISDQKIPQSCPNFQNSENIWSAQKIPILVSFTKCHIKVNISIFIPQKTVSKNLFFMQSQLVIKSCRNLSLRNSSNMPSNYFGHFFVG